MYDWLRPTFNPQINRSVQTSTQFWLQLKQFMCVRLCGHHSIPELGTRDNCRDSLTHIMGFAFGIPFFYAHWEMFIRKVCLNLHDHIISASFEGTVQQDLWPPGFFRIQLICWVNRILGSKKPTPQSIIPKGVKHFFFFLKLFLKCKI